MRTKDVLWRPGRFRYVHVTARRGGQEISVKYGLAMKFPVPTNSSTATMPAKSLRQRLGPAFASIAGLLLIGVFVRADAAMVHVRGTVVSEDNHRLVEATVTVVVPGQHVSGPHPTLLGKVDFEVEAGAATYVIARIESPHYQTTRLNVDVIDGVANLTTVTLKALPGIELSRLYYFPPPDLDTTSGRFDVYVTNQMTTALRIDSMRFVATKKKKTYCADLPGLHNYVFSIRNELQVRNDAESDLLVDVRAGAAMDPGIVAASGRIEYLPCEQARLSLEITYP